MRIAIHTGEAHERDGDYFGPALNRAARLRALAPGAATLLSQATTEIVHDHLPPGTELIDLGSQKLRGLSRPEQVFELRTTAAATDAISPRGARDPQDGHGPLCVRDRARRRRRRLPTPRRAAGSARATSTACGRCSNDTAGRSRHTRATRSWPCSACRRSTTTMRCARCGRRLSSRRCSRSSRTNWTRPSACGSAPVSGVGTGEVIAERPAPGSPPASGHVVNAAKRLEEAAGAGEILIDDATHRVVRDFVDVEPATSGSRVLALRRERCAPAEARLPAGRARPADRGAVERRGRGGGRPLVPPRDRAGRRGRGEVAARGGLRRRAGRARVRPARPLPAVRRGDHLLAARRGRA